MSHFAEIDENNVVIRVLVGDNTLRNEGYNWFVDNLGGTWIQTSYNANFRNKFAATGDIYREDLDAFISPQPYPSWSLDEDLVWVAPKPLPDMDNFYEWDEEKQEWQLISTAD